MTPVRQIIATSLLGLAFASSFGASAAAPTDLAARLNCPIPLATAKDNLLSLGYKIESSSPESFTTYYKVSDRDSVKKLLGSYSLQRERQYLVSANGDGAIRFVPRHRETRFASEGPSFKGKSDEVSSFPVPLSEAMADTLQDMQAEVCMPAERKAAKAHIEQKSQNLDQYLRDRCKSGDDAACQLLSAK
jgi:hypothetical protein